MGEKRNSNNMYLNYNRHSYVIEKKKDFCSVARVTYTNFRT